MASCDFPIPLLGGTTMKKQRLNRYESLVGLIVVIGQFLNGHLRAFVTSTLFTFYLVVVVGMAFIPVGLLMARTFTRNQEAMTNVTVIELVKAGIGDEVIIQLIRRSKTKFDLSPGAIVQRRCALPSWDGASVSFSEFRK
ncbi:MAG: hypothetical protein QW087_08085 [Methanomassiliicoccales archaeon]